MRWITWSVYIFLGIASAIQGSQKEAEVDASLGSSIENIKGLVWPTTNKVPRESTAVDSECQVTLRLTGRQIFRTFSKTVWLSQRDGKVRTVDIMPLRRATDFLVAIREVEEFQKHIILKDKTELAEALEVWKKDPGNKNRPNSRSIRVRVNEDIDLRIEVEYNDIQKGWLVIFSFNVPKLFE